jgi:hypothetical protein
MPNGSQSAHLAPRGFEMCKRFLFVSITAVTLIGGVNAQIQSRRMTQVGGGTPDRGKCTVEVVVDGSAEVEIRGNTATLKDLGGAQPQWRRFECTGPLPSNPAYFRFAGVDGRGRQQLTRDPRGSGSAIIRIDDPDNGSEGYTFDIFWGNAPPPVQSRGDNPGFDRDGDSFHHDREEAFRRDDWRMHLFARIREDLDHIQASTFPFSRDQTRLVQAKRELDQLQDMQSRGRYDRRQLDDVVGALKIVVNDNRLAGRDREVLNDDLARLQEFSAHLHDYGVR